MLSITLKLVVTTGKDNNDVVFTNYNKDFEF